MSPRYLHFKQFCSILLFSLSATVLSLNLSLIFRLFNLCQCCKTIIKFNLQGYVIVFFIFTGSSRHWWMGPILPKLKWKKSFHKVKIVYFKNVNLCLITNIRANWLFLLTDWLISKQPVLYHYLQLSQISQICAIFT